MSREETTILAILLAGLVAIILWKVRAPMDETEGIPALSRAVSNLTVNQPFMFSPPVANIIPNMAASQLGETIPQDDPYYSASNCGCY